MFLYLYKSKDLAVSRLSNYNDHKKSNPYLLSGWLLFLMRSLGFLFTPQHSHLQISFSATGPQIPASSSHFLFALPLQSSSRHRFISCSLYWCFCFISLYWVLPKRFYLRVLGPIWSVALVGLLLLGRHCGSKNWMAGNAWWLKMFIIGFNPKVATYRQLSYTSRYKHLSVGIITTY